MRQFIYILKDMFHSPLWGVEVGVERGDNAADILRTLPIDQLALIDIWKPFVQEGKEIWNDAICEGNYQYVLERFADDIGMKVEVLRMPSVEAAKQIRSGLDFVYLDACHQYESVVEDVRTWLPKIRKGGLLAGHDYHPLWPGVIQAANEAATNLRVKLEHGTGPTESVEDWWFQV